MDAGVVLGLDAGASLRAITRLLRREVATGPVASRAGARSVLLPSSEGILGIRITQWYDMRESRGRQDTYTSTATHFHLFRVLGAGLRRLPRVWRGRAGAWRVALHDKDMGYIHRGGASHATRGDEGGYLGSAWWGALPHGYPRALT